MVQDAAILRDKMWTLNLVTVPRIKRKLVYTFGRV